MLKYILTIPTLVLSCDYFLMEDIERGIGLGIVTLLILEMIIEMLLRKGFSRNMAERNAKIMIEDMATQNWNCLMKDDPELN